MRSVVYDTTGDPDVLHLVDRPEPEPGAGEVRVRIAVSGVNPTDWKARRGDGAPRALDAPHVPNQDGAGTVDAIGAGVDDLAVGDRVWVWDAAYRRPEGTAQEAVVLPRRQVVVLPDAIGFEVGASLGIPALTAHRALTSHDRSPQQLRPGALDGLTVLVTGGAGAVGHAAIQLARWAGARVIATVSSPEKAALASAAGAHDVIDYRREDVAAAVHALRPAGADIVVDVDAAANIDASLAACADGATIAVYATAALTELTMPIRPAMVKNVRLQFLLTYTFSTADKDAAVAAVSAATADGAMSVGESAGLPLHRFALDDTAGAHAAAERGVVGKVLIDVAG
jgi:NADPH:quinone reductase